MKYQVRTALQRLVIWARAQAGDIQYSGDHPIAMAEAALASQPQEPPCRLSEPTIGQQVCRALKGMT